MIHLFPEESFTIKNRKLEIQPTGNRALHYTSEFNPKLAPHILPITEVQMLAGYLIEQYCL